MAARASLCICIRVPSGSRLVACDQECRPGVSPLGGNPGGEAGFSQDSSLAPFHDPSLYAEPLARRGTAVKANIQACGESLQSASQDRLRHGLVQHGCNNSAMDCALKTLPPLVGNPACHNPSCARLEREVQTRGVLSSAGKTVGIDCFGPVCSGWQENWVRAVPTRVGLDGLGFQEGWLIIRHLHEAPVSSFAIPRSRRG